MLADLLHASIAVCLLSPVACLIYVNFTDLPLEPFLFGEAIGIPIGITLLTLASPRRGRCSPAAGWSWRSGGALRRSRRLG